MKRSRKSKSVSWAHGVNLCQVRLYSSEDCPLKVGLKSSDHLRAKTSLMLPKHTIESNDCPPGFNVTHSRNQLADVSCIPLVKWKCPPKFAMSCHWRVAAGEESKEIKSQNFREMRLLEAIYPRASDIPPCASVSTEINNEPYNDSLTPIVPIIPIEEDECGVLESDSTAVGDFSTSSKQTTRASNVQLETETQPPIHVSSIKTSTAVEMPAEKLPDVGVDVDVGAAASAALAVLMKSMEEGSMIDTDLLIKIFNDPTMIQNLTNILPLFKADPQRPPTAIAAPTPVSKPIAQSISLPVLKSDTIQKLPSLPNGSLPNVSDGVVPSSVTTLPQVSYVPASNVKPASVSDRVPASNLQKVKTTIPSAGNYSNTGAVPSQANIAPVRVVRKEDQQLKDLNYFKNLIRQHGDQKEDVRKRKLGLNGNNNHHKLNMVDEIKAENLKRQNQKQCVYFNSAKGCRRGVNCLYRHDMSHNWRTNNVFESQTAKRMKLWGEVAGRT